MVIVCIAADLIPGSLGGAEVHAVEVIKRLARRHQIILFVGKDTSIRVLFPHNVTVVPVIYPRIPNLMGLSYILFGYPQILSKIYHLSSNIDIVWAKQSFPQGVVAARLKNKIKVPLYITAQNPRLHYEELVLKGFYLKPFHFLLAKLIDPLISWSYSKADMVAAVSRYAGKLAKSYGAKHIKIIPNGISPVDYKMHRRGSHSPWRLFTASSLIPRNGLDVLIKTVALLPKDLDWHLTIAGDGPELKQLQNMVGANNYLPLQKQISFLGRVSNKDIPPMLQQADIFIRPSRYEGFGVSFLEAMASGVPVIGTKVGGIPDFVHHLETGLLVEPENPTAVAEAIVKLMGDPKLYFTLQKNALDLSRKCYNWDIISREVESTMLKITRKS